MRCSFALSLIFILFSSNILEAKPRCEVLHDKIYNEGSDQDVNTKMVENQKTIGIRLLKAIDKDAIYSFLELLSFTFSMCDFYLPLYNYE